MRYLLNLLPENLSAHDFHIANRVLKSGNCSRRERALCGAIFGPIFQYIGENFGFMVEED